MNKDKLYSEDLIRICHYISDSIPYDHPDRDEERKREYIRILERMADSMLSDDAIVIGDDFFDREHGV